MLKEPCEYFYQCLIVCPYIWCKGNYVIRDVLHPGTFRVILAIVAELVLDVFPERILLRKKPTVFYISKDFYNS